MHVSGHHVSERVLHVQLLQCRGEASVSSGASNSKRQASQRIRDAQSQTVPAVEELCRPLMAQRTCPHLEYT